MLSQIFCSGQVQLEDGRILVVGGHNGGEFGIQTTNIFDPTTNTWSAGRQHGLPALVPDARRSCLTAAS